ncbi:MAG: sigma-70 family RNA polymerase sigma factor [Alteromonadales bacterium]|nr:sigma-70 family RNA polymerase sigma factor [Alteromonadales bacterium]
MKKYNIANYIRYKQDVKDSMPEDKFYDYYTRDEMIKKFLPLVETMANKFSTADFASGVLTKLDLLQIGNEALTKAVDKLDWNILIDKEDVEKSLKSFFSKRIKGAIRRRIDRHRGNIRIPEHRLNTMRSTKDKKMVQMFFNSIFLSIDKPIKNEEENMYHQIQDKSEPYNIALLNSYLKSLMLKHLKDKEYEVLRLSYGLDCDKHSAKEIADKLKIPGVSNYVRVSEIKRQAVDKLIDNVDHSQVLDYL